VKRAAPFLVILIAVGLMPLAERTAMPVMDFLGNWSPLGFTMAGIDWLVGPVGWDALINLLGRDWWKSAGMVIVYAISSASAIGGVFFIPYLVAGLIARERRGWVALSGSAVLCAYFLFTQDSPHWSVALLYVFIALPFLLATFLIGNFVSSKLRSRRAPTC
jgi:hypothetical protein